MSKKKKIIGILSIAVIVIIIISASVLGWRRHRVTVMLNEQNYVASRLLELGNYDEGRSLAAQSEQMRANTISKELIVLAAGFQEEYQLGIVYADRYLRESEDALLQNARVIFQEYLDACELLPAEYEPGYEEQLRALKDSAYEKLLAQLLNVQNSISVKKVDERYQAMLDLWTMSGNTSEALKILEKDNSLMSQKVLAEYAINTGNYQEAFERLETVLAVNPSFENRARLANIVAEQAVNTGSDERIVSLQDKQRELSQQLSETQAAYAREESSYRASRLSKEIEDIREEIEEIQEELRIIPVNKAVNFLVATTPLGERETVAYRLELAQLYYLAGEEQKASDILVDVLKEEKTSLEPAEFYLWELADAYRGSVGVAQEIGIDYVNGNGMQISWNRLKSLLGFIERNDYGISNEDFYSFLIRVMDRLYNGLIIRRIDTTQFPTVRVTINVAMELEQKLEKNNFTVEDMQVSLNQFDLIAGEDMEKTAGEMSVVLVVDRSGSMAGQPMEDTKRAVSEFVKGMDADIQVGAVAFDSNAELIAPLSENKNHVVSEINAINASGGTNIYSGLQEAGLELENAAGTKIIILLSDGEDGNAGIIDEVLDDLNRKGIFVYTIGFGGADTEYLTYIAQRCGGKFLQAASSQALGEIYAAIGEYMVNDYIIEFTVETDPEDFSRHIKIMVDINDAYVEEDYNVGVPLEDILLEEGQRPMSNYFRQVGGSDMSE